MLPGPNELQFFIEVVSTGNLSRAAERLGITQPALSQAMKRLEAQVGGALLVRSKTGVVPTRAGEKLALRAKGLMEEWEKLKDETLRDDSEVRGRYGLGMHSAVALYCLPHFLPQLLEQHPQLEFRLDHDLSRKITEQIVSFKLDFGIVVNPFPHPDLVIKELFKDEVGFYRSKKLNANNDLKSQRNVLIMEPDLVQSQSLVSQALKKKIQFSRTVTSSSLEVIKHLALKGAGIGILPGRVVGPTVRDMKKLELPSYEDRICLVYRADAQKSQAAKYLIKTISENLKKSHN